MKYEAILHTILLRARRELGMKISRPRNFFVITISVKAITPYKTHARHDYLSFFTLTLQLISVKERDKFIALVPKRRRKSEATFFS